MKNISSQSGRSMVEMLGVLAVIGVLSVGGIAGYRYALDRYTRNKILTLLHYGAMASQIERAKDPVLKLFLADMTTKEREDLFCKNYVGDSFCQQGHPSLTETATNYKYKISEPFMGFSGVGTFWRIHPVDWATCFCENDPILSIDIIPPKLCEELIDIALQTYDENTLIGFVGYNTLDRKMPVATIKKQLCYWNGTLPENGLTNVAFIFRGNIDDDTTCAPCFSYCPASINKYCDCPEGNKYCN